MSVPIKYAQEARAPDSIQFNLVGLSDDQTQSFVAAAKQRGLGIQVFGMTKDNARAFWNWQFLPEMPALPQTKAMLMRACDVRLPARLRLSECDVIAQIIIDAVNATMSPEHNRPKGTSHAITDA